jgi:hypothetical protein
MNNSKKSYKSNVKEKRNETKKEKHKTCKMG